MTFLRLSELGPQYQKSMGIQDMRGFEVYTERQEKVGRIADILVDQTGRFQYFVVNLQPTAASQQVLLGLKQGQVDFDRQRVYVSKLSHRDVMNLPHYTNQTTLTTETVGSTNPLLSTPVEASRPLQVSTPVEVSAPLENSTALETSRVIRQPVVPEAYLEGHRAQTMAQPVETHRVEPAPIVPEVALSETQVQTPVVTHGTVRGNVVEQELIPLLEEKLLVQYRRRKVGDVIVRKEVETRMIQVPVRREKLIVEQVTPERRPLAVVDLLDDPTDESIELFPISRTQGSTLNASFPSAQVASEFLEAIAASIPQSSAPVKVTIAIADSSLKPTYEQVAHRYSTQNPA